MGRNRRKWAWVGTIVITFTLLMMAYYWFIATDRVNGTVSHKTIGGVRNDVAYTLVSFTPDGLIVKADDLEDLFAGMDANMTVTTELEKEIRDRGYTIHYVGNVRLSSPDNVNGLKPDDTRGYFVTDVQDFNRLVLDSNVTIEVAHNELNTIRDVH